jgi:hypothetical protein
MAKFKTRPDLGSRKIVFPVIGEVSVVDGVVDIPDDKVEEILSIDFGIKLISEGEDGVELVANKQVEGMNITIESLKRDMPRLTDINEAWENIKHLATEAEVEDFNKGKKDDKYPVILSILNRGEEENQTEEG